MKELSVTKIQNGTVIDHIRAGQGLRILHILCPTDHSHQVTLGLNLKSSLLGLKDLIKIEGVFLTESHTAQIALFSPQATVNVIRATEVVTKYKVRLPDRIAILISCPNRLCITNTDRISTHFSILEQNGTVRLRCLYCEKVHQPEPRITKKESSVYASH